VGWRWLLLLFLLKPGEAQTVTTKTDAEWKAILTPEQYRLLRQSGTERAGSGTYLNTREPGVYRCAGCGAELFRSDTKFDSGSGWPSFWAPLAAERVRLSEDMSYGMRRIEARGAACDGHLGHVFEDVPTPTRQRF
jgi:peptide-methionine (R)-S-oxide reductase